MFNRFEAEARAIVRRAEDQARMRGERTIEAEHILLAIEFPPEVADQIASALDSERDEALAAVGIDRTDFGLPARQPLATRPRFGTTAKRALEQALSVATRTKARRIGTGQILLGVLEMKEGRVPRALRVAGIDHATLIEAAVEPI